jgi:hypothetical protein
MSCMICNSLSWSVVLNADVKITATSNYSINRWLTGNSFGKNTPVSRVEFELATYTVASWSSTSQRSPPR